MLTKNQQSRRTINAKLKRIGLDLLVTAALNGDELALAKLKIAASRDKSVAKVLLLLQTRRNPKNRQKNQPTPLEMAGIASNGRVFLTQGGAPGLKSRN